MLVKVSASDAHQSPMGGWTQLNSRDGATIRVEVAYPHLSVVVERPGTAPDRVSLAYPRAGYGGHELLLSPEETYLVMWLYSGQSEVGYELFRFRPSLRHLDGFPYVFGEGEGPAFSPDESVLALAWATNPALYVETEDVDDSGCTLAECVVDWVTVRVQELPGGPATTCRISALVPAGFPVEGDDSYHPTRLEVVGGREIRLQPEWGTAVHVPLPLPKALTIRGPQLRTAR